MARAKDVGLELGFISVSQKRTIVTYKVLQRITNMQFIKTLIICSILFFSFSSKAQFTIEGGVPNLSLTKTQFQSTGLRMGSYLKVGYQKDKIGFGLTGITKSSLGLAGNEFFIGPYVNYRLKLKENSPLTIVPEVSMLYSQRKQSTEMGFDQYKLPTANVGVGLEYKLNKNWSLTYSLAVGMGREQVEYADSEVNRPIKLTSSFPLMHSFGIKYTFSKRKKTPKVRVFI